MYEFLTLLDPSATIRKNIVTLKGSYASKISVDQPRFVNDDNTVGDTLHVAVQGFVNNGLDVPFAARPIPDSLVRIHGATLPTKVSFTHLGGTQVIPIVVDNSPDPPEVPVWKNSEKELMSWWITQASNAAKAAAASAWTPALLDVTGIRDGMVSVTYHATFRYVDTNTGADACKNQTVIVSGRGVTANRELPSQVVGALSNDLPWLEPMKDFNNTMKIADIFDLHFNSTTPTTRYVKFYISKSKSVPGDQPMVEFYGKDGKLFLTVGGKDAKKQ